MTLLREKNPKFDDLRRYIAENYIDESPDHVFKRKAASSISFYGRESTPSEESADLAIDESSTGDYEYSSHSCCESVSPSSAAEEDLDWEAYLRRTEPTFSEYLMHLLIEKDAKNSEVYKRAAVSKALFSKIISDRDYQPKKTTAIQLAIGLELDLNQTQKLLDTAGYSLTRSSKADLVVKYYIEQGQYDVMLINEALFDCGLPLLTTGLKA